MLINSISMRINKTFAVILTAGLIAGALAIPFVKAIGPIFNAFPISYTGERNHDLPMIDAKNVSKGEGWSVDQADHDRGIAADPGDVIEFSIYYHNSAADTDANVAINTIIKAF